MYSYMVKMIILLESLPTACHLLLDSGKDCLQKQDRELPLVQAQLAHFLQTPSATLSVSSSLASLIPCS